MVKIGVVVIGRNEGASLEACLDSLVGGELPVVYVDSASTDGSAARALARGCDGVSLPADPPPSAARARNVGFDRLCANRPDLDYVQFVDGDCVLHEGWLEAAARELDARPRASVVFGRLRERHPEASVYNRLCDMEWEGPAGEVESCGGIALMRASAFRRAGGFNPDVPAGEEPELCLRLRRAGWTIVRLDIPMASHDAAMTRFGQWWTRNVRFGRATAQALAMHGRSADRFGLRDACRILGWTLGPPLAVMALWIPLGASGLLAGLAYPLLWLRILWTRCRRGARRRDAGLYATFCILSKWPQLLGLVRHGIRWRRPRSGRLPDTSDAPSTAGGGTEARPPTPEQAS
jgi:GT2 family glycosyltransferase